MNYLIAHSKFTSIRIFNSWALHGRSESRSWALSCTPYNLVMRNALRQVIGEQEEQYRAQY